MLITLINSYFYCLFLGCTRWFKYDRDYLCVDKSQFVPVIFEPPCIFLVNFEVFFTDINNHKSELFFTQLLY